MNKLTLLAGIAIGYVLGARAGRERYEQIAAGARKVAGQPARSRPPSSKAQDDRRRAGAGRRPPTRSRTRTPRPRSPRASPTRCTAATADGDRRSHAAAPARRRHGPADLTAGTPARLARGPRRSSR